MQDDAGYLFENDTPSANASAEDIMRASAADAAPSASDAAAVDVGKAASFKILSQAK